MTALRRALMAVGNGLDVADVFSAVTYTSNEATQTITSGINLDAYDGSVWIKNVDSAQKHVVATTVAGTGKYLSTNATTGQSTDATTVTAFNDDGFSIGAAPEVNRGTDENVAWTFRKNRKFYHLSEEIKSSSTDKTVDLSALGVVGMARVKRIDSSGSWYVWHKDLTAGDLLIGETTAAETTLGHITLSGTTLTLEDGVIADGTYLVEAWAHEPGTSGIIQCAVVTTDGSGNASYAHGWSGVQFASLKAISTTGDWEMYDTARSPSWTTDKRLRANLSNIQDTVTRISDSAGTVSFTGLSTPQTYVLMVIRSES